MANNAQLTKQQEGFASLAWGDYTPTDIQTIKETYGRDLNDSQFKLYLGVAKSVGSNPLLGEVHASIYKGVMSIQYGIDLYKRKARENPNYEGHDSQLIHANDEFKAEQVIENGKAFMRVTKHEITVPRGEVVGCYATAYAKGKTPYTVIMEVDEVLHFQKSDLGMQKTMWTKYFNDMFQKYVLKRVLKDAFGLVLPDENEPMEPAPTGGGSYDGRVDVTPIDDLPDALPETTPEVEVIDAGGKQSEVDTLRKDMYSLLNKLGVQKEGIKEYFELNDLTMSNPPTIEEYKAAIKSLKMDVDMKGSDPL
jgi:recombination protein RecT